MTTLIGGTCKRGNAFSGPVLITRGLDLNTVESLWSFEGARGRTPVHNLPVVIAAGKNLFPFRTEKLRPPAPMGLGGEPPRGGGPPGRVGRRRFSRRRGPAAALFASRDQDARFRPLAASLASQGRVRVTAARARRAGGGCRRARRCPRQGRG